MVAQHGASTLGNPDRGMRWGASSKLEEIDRANKEVCICRNVLLYGKLWRIGLMELIFTETEAAQLYGHQDKMI